MFVHLFSVACEFLDFPTLAELVKLACWAGSAQALAARDGRLFDRDVEIVLIA